MQTGLLQHHTQCLAAPAQYKPSGGNEQQLRQHPGQYVKTSNSNILHLKQNSLPTRDCNQSFLVTYSLDMMNVFSRVSDEVRVGPTSPIWKTLLTQQAGGLHQAILLFSCQLCRYYFFDCFWPIKTLINEDLYYGSQYCTHKH